MGTKHPLDQSEIVNKQLITHSSVEISGFFYHSDFTWNQFVGFWKCKICHFNTFRGFELWFLWIFGLSEGWIWPKLKSAEPLKLQRKFFLSFRFYVKSILENLEGPKLTFCNFRGSGFCCFGKFKPSKSAKIHENQKSEPQNMLKWQILHF